MSEFRRGMVRETQSHQWASIVLRRKIDNSQKNKKNSADLDQRKWYFQF